MSSGPRAIRGRVLAIENGVALVRCDSEDVEVPGRPEWRPGDLIDGDRVVRVKPEPLNNLSMIGFHSPYDKRFAHHAQSLVENVKIRGLGSSTLHLAYVAVGILDGTVDHNVKIWDIAAAVPLCLAGRGEVQFLNGEQFPLKQFDLKMGRIFYVAGNATVCAQLRKVLGV